LFCSSDRNFFQFTTLSCTLLFIFLILVCFGCFFFLLFFFFVFRKFLSTLFVFCSKYLSELHSRLRYFRWRAKFVFWRVSWSLLLPELYSSIWRRCGR
jgi:hypothetical protein